MSGLEVGSALGGYRILARLRAGAMGVLYLARRIGPGGFARPVAIKVIHDHLAQNKRFCKMFVSEAKLSARIDDPHVVRVEEFGEVDRRFYMVMEYVHGASLAQMLGVLGKRGGIPLDVAVAVARDVAAGLHAAHEATDENGAPLGIVHRDVSPHNILVSYKGAVKVIDFGIAKAKESSGQTLTGSLRGKLAYMPPEQARSAKHVDRRADLYALGLVLWEMLAGRRMFDGTNDLALLNQIKNPVIVPPSAVNPRVPADLDAVVLKMLALDPDKRPKDAALVARMLGEAWPRSTQLLAIDVAAVMNDVARLASSAKEEADDEEGSGAHGSEVKKGLTIFGRSMHESVELADGVLEGLESTRDLSQNETAVMTSPPVSRGKMAKDTIRTDAIALPPPPPPSAPSVIVDQGEDTTLRFRSSRGGASARTVMKAKRPWEEPPSNGVRGALPAWLTPPVMVLAPLTLALFVALVAVECGRRNEASPTTPHAAIPASAAKYPESRR